MFHYLSRENREAHEKNANGSILRRNQNTSQSSSNDVPPEAIPVPTTAKKPRFGPDLDVPIGFLNRKEASNDEREASDEEKEEEIEVETELFARDYEPTPKPKQKTSLLGFVKRAAIREQWYDHVPLDKKHTLGENILCLCQWTQQWLKNLVEQLHICSPGYIAGYTV